MIYTAVRLSVDIVYWVGRITVDGAYYMVYGHQETQQEKMENHIKMLEMRIEEKSLTERENNLLLVKLAKKNGIKIDPPTEEIEENTLLIN